MLGPSRTTASITSSPSRRGKRSRTSCWKGVFHIAIVGILSTYAVGMWFGLRYALYSSDYENQAKVKAIAILGERNSGTRWLWTHLNECFNHSIPVKRELVRYKHWFQSPYNTSKIADNTLVITLFRNVYELSLIHISEPTRQEAISYAVFCLKKKNHGSVGRLQFQA